jgi:hypothetical protein
MAFGASVSVAGTDVAKAPKININAKPTEQNRISLKQGYVRLSI